MDEKEGVKKIWFYPEPDIAAWYGSLPKYKGTQIINETLRKGVQGRFYGVAQQLKQSLAEQQASQTFQSLMPGGGWQAIMRFRADDGKWYSRYFPVVAWASTALGQVVGLIQDPRGYNIALIPPAIGEIEQFFGYLPSEKEAQDACSRLMEHKLPPPPPYE